MANDALATRSASHSFDSRIAEAGLVILLLLVIVGLTPLDDRSAAALLARDATTASGDLLRQVSFLGTFALILFAAWRRHGLALVRGVPVSLLVLMGWCVLTALWALEPDVVVRRAVLATIFVVSMLLSVDTLGTARTLAIWRVALAAVIVGDLLSVALFHQAVHLANDQESNLAGAWRGLHAHKNSAGAFAATAALAFFYFALETRRRSDMLFCALALFFLVMTRSKSSLGLLPVALVTSAFYRLAWKSSLDRAISAVTVALATVILVFAVAAEWDVIVRFLEDPQHFTGRAAIWQAELAYAHDHPLFGAGFGTFGNTGARSPIFHYIGGGWVSQIGEGHSGYLEMLVTIGGIGFALGMLVVVVLPFAQFWQSERSDANLNAMLFALFFFDVLHNFMESDFIQVATAQWGQVLLIIALLRVSKREARQGRAAVASWA